MRTSCAVVWELGERQPGSSRPSGLHDSKAGLAFNDWAAQVGQVASWNIITAGLAFKIGGLSRPSGQQQMLQTVEKKKLTDKSKE